MILARKDFPAGFLFGAATAAYQIEGAQFGGCGPSHWDSFAATPGNVVRAENGALACDHYHRWPEDLDLMKSAGFDAYRFSASWARVMPDGKTLNPEGLDFYDRLVDGMLARDLAPFLTLYHWELPSALADAGGWANRETCLRFADYAQTVMARLGDRIQTTATLNEPWCIAWLSHFLGIHAPGLRDIRAAARAMHHVMLAHGLAVQALRAQGHKNLGIVLNFDHTTPQSDRHSDHAAAARQDAICNRWFIEALTKGRYPLEALEGLAPHMPHAWQDDMALIAQPLDWLGVNYYTRHLVAHAPQSPWPSTKSSAGDLPQTAMGWEVYPQGLCDFLTRLTRDYTRDLPLYVTENGAAFSDSLQNGAVDDPDRVNFIAAHLRAVEGAIAQGAPVKGFFYWSLLDNYEWAEGYEKRFGLIHIDFKTLARTPKSSYIAFKRALGQK